MMCEMGPVLLSADFSVYRPYVFDNDNIDLAFDDLTSDLLTPPWSPCGSSGLSCIQDFDDESPLLNDCMWSAGLLPPSFSNRRPVQDATAAVDGRCASPLRENPVPTYLTSPMTTVTVETKSHTNEVKSAESVTVGGWRTASVEDVQKTIDFCGLPTSQSRCQDSNRCQDDEDSSEDVDVVSVSPTSCHSLSSSSIVRELLVMPPSSSVLAHVNAIHNYSSSGDVSSPTSTLVAVSTPWPSRFRSSRKAPNSAPQSPASRRRVAWRRKQSLDDQLVGSLSMPSSPIQRQRRDWHRRHGETSGGCSDSSEETATRPIYRRRSGTGGGKRALHNVLERRRRDHLKWNFEALRIVVPTSTDSARMPKVAILRRARDYVRHLRLTGERLELERSRLRSLQQRWQHKLALLNCCE